MSNPINRIKSDYTKLQRENLEYASVNLTDDAFKWEVTIMGPPDSPYEGGSFNFIIEFPKNYSLRAPHITLVTKLYHPLVDKTTNEYCDQNVTENWRASFTVINIIKKLYDMLENPQQFEQGHDATVTEQCRDNYEEFCETARKWTEEYAS